MRNSTDLSRRWRWTQPAIVTVAPTQAGRADARVRCTMTSFDTLSNAFPGGAGEGLVESQYRCLLAVPPHLHPFVRHGPYERASFGVPARECLQGPAPDRLSSYRRLSVLAGSGPYSSPSSPSVP